MAVKRNYNPKSRENLRQYQNLKQKKQKEEITQEILEEVSIDEELIELIVSAKDICKDKKEQERFMKYVKEYLKEYGKKGAELTISDIDDIATLCMNNIIITRMLKDSKDSPGDVMAAVHRLKQDNIKLKENLASSRKDRVDPRAGNTITVNDLLDDYMTGRRIDFEEQKKIYKEEEEEFKDLIKTSVEELIT